MQNIREPEIRGLNRSFPVISHSRVTRRGMDRGTLNAITMSKKTRESLTEKIPVGQREIKEETERKLDVVAEETAPRTFIRRIRTRFLTAFPTESSENFDGGWHNERTKNRNRRSLKEFRSRFKRF